MADQKISDLTEATSVGGTEYVEMVQSGVNKKVPTSLLATTREFNRTFSEELLFDKNEIFHTPFSQTGDLNLTIASGGLVDQASVMRFRMIADGVSSINFGAGFDFLYGVTNGEILEAGNYEFYFLYTNGSVTVNVPGVTQQSSSLIQLTTPSDFHVDPNGENQLDMSWSDVANESGYQIEKSLTGTGGWVLYSNPVSGATSASEAGLNPGDTVFYRIKAVGDGVTYTDSPYTVASGTTEDTGDVTAPTFTFNPANGNAVWPVNKSLTITANEALRKDDGSALISNDTGIIVLKQTNSGGSDIACTWTIDVTKTIITITPTTTLGTNQLVYLAIDGVEDVSGNEVSLTSITFTTTEYSYFNGTSNRIVFGDILDSLFAVADVNFWLEITVNNSAMSGSRTLHNKLSGADQSFRFYYNTDSFIFYFSMAGSGNRSRAIVWDSTDMDSGEHTIVLKYNGAIDTNDGLDRCTLLIDGVIQTSKTVTNPVGSLSSTLDNAAAQLSLGIDVNSIGTPTGTTWFEGEAKNMIIRSNSGGTVEMNINVLRVGTDSSGNARNGTWV